MFFLFFLLLLIAYFFEVMVLLPLTILCLTVATSNSEAMVTPVQVNQFNFYGGNIQGKARLSGMTAKSKSNSKIYRSTDLSSVSTATRGCKSDACTPLAECFVGTINLQNNHI